MSRMQNLANSIAQNNWLSSLDLNSAYDRVPILPKEGVVYCVRNQWPVLPVQINTVGLKNAVPLFQSVISETMSKHNCKRLMLIWMTVQYVCGRTREEHEENLKCILNAT